MDKLGNKKTPLFYNTFCVVSTESVLTRLSKVVLYVVAMFVVVSTAKAFGWFVGGISALILAGVLLFVVRDIWKFTETVITKKRLREYQPHIIYSNVSRGIAQKTILYQQYLEKKGSKDYSLYLLKQDKKSLLYNLGLTITKSNEYESRAVADTTYYTVFEGILDREVPNIVFDSHDAHGRQFRSYFVGAQKVMLDVDMNDYYEAFAPKGYHIDALRIIGPEVLGVMKEFSLPCDVEFNGKSVLCYAPLLPHSKIAEFYEQCESLAVKCNDTLVSYRDDHAYGKERVDGVHGFARSLLRSPFYRWPYLIMSMTIGVLIFVFAIMNGGWSSFVQEPIVVFFGCMLLVSEPYQVFRQWRKNQKQIRSFEASQKFVDAQNSSERQS